MSDVSAVVRQVEEARRWIDAYDAVHPLTEHGSGHEIMGLMLDGEHAFLTTDRLRTLLDALSAAERREGELREAAQAVIDFNRGQWHHGWRPDELKLIAALAAPAEPVEGAEG